MYVRRFFDTDAQGKIMEMVGDIREEFQEVLKAAQWMDPLTKRSALIKAQSMVAHIGHPIELLDDNKIEDYYKTVMFTKNLFKK